MPAPADRARPSLRDRLRPRCRTVTIPAELIVERDGRPVAVLSDPQFDDMFWFAWRITPLADDAAVTSDAFWTHGHEATTVFRCKSSGAVAKTAFWAGADPVRGGRLILRGAYVPAEVSFRQNPFTWLKLLLLGGS
jgi:hypothetical protein